MFDPLQPGPAVNDQANEAVESEQGLVHVAPIPEDAPEPPVLTGSHRWWYRDKHGRSLAAVDRHEPRRPGERKSFLPLTLWQSEDGSFQWRRRHPPVKRPLYGLDRLADRPDAPVIVTEGEKATEAATRLFPTHVAVTSSCGANAAAAADWTPLAGRNVTIWRDNDDEGLDYVAHVTHLATEAGAGSFFIVNVPSNWPEGWDVADQLPEGTTIETLQSMVESAIDYRNWEGSSGSKMDKPLTAPEESEESNNASKGFRTSSAGSVDIWVPEGFSIGTDGSILHGANDDERQFLCSPLVVVAATRNAAGEDWGRLLRIRDRDGVWHEWALPMAELAGDGDAYRARLLSLGLELEPGAVARKALHRLLTTANPQARIRCVPTLGWHGGAFVLPDEVIGEPIGDRLTLQTSAPLQHNFKVAGTLEDWRDSIAELAIGNSRLVLALSMAFAGPLYRLLKVEGGGFHFRGASSTGKTTLGEAAGSICGGGPNGYKQTWRATENGLETIASLHNDGFLVLDEINQVSPEALGQSAYMLSNGQGKRRMTRDATARHSVSWLVAFLSTGEIGLADKIRESRRGSGRAMAGQQVRIVDLPADAAAGHGVFDTLHGFASGQVLADHLKKASAEYYGTALRSLLRRLADDPTATERVRKCMRDFEAKAVPAGSDGQVLRVAQRFGLVAAAGELARDWGIVPWPEGEATKAALRLFNEWLVARGGNEPAEIADGIARVRHFLEQHGPARFAHWDEPGRAVQNRAGFWRQGDSGPIYYVLPEAWRNDVLAGHDAGLIAREMARRGMLKANADGKPQTAHQLPDGKPKRKVYVVLPSIFETVP